MFGEGVGHVVQEAEAGVDVYLLRFTGLGGVGFAVAIGFVCVVQDSAVEVEEEVCDMTCVS